MDANFISYDELQREAEKLVALLKDREPGMMSWHGLLHERLEQLHEITTKALNKRSLKRYIVFCDRGYDSSGGWYDIIARFEGEDRGDEPASNDPAAARQDEMPWSTDDLDEARRVCTRLCDNVTDYYIVDLQVGKVVD